MATDLDAQLEKDLERLVQDMRLTDAVLKGSDGEVPVHQAMLYLRCPELLPTREPETEKHTDSAGDESVVIERKEDTRTLNSFVRFLYKDKLEDNLTCAELVCLMVFAASLFAGEVDEDLPARRLHALCEKQVHEQLKLGDLSTALEVLKCALSNELSVLEQSVYKLLADKKVEGVAFARDLVKTLLPDHEEALPYVLAATWGNADPKEMDAADTKEPSGEVPPSRLLKDLRKLLDHAKKSELPGSQQPFVDCGIAAEGEATGIGAHRFILLLRAECEVPKNTSRHLSTQPPPSRKALEALLSFLYTAAWEVEGADQTDYFDLLQILGDDDLKLSGQEALRSAVEHRVLSGDGEDDWQLLRRATKCGNDVVKAKAKERVLVKCFQLRGNREALAASYRVKTDCTSWWTADDGVQMMEDVLWSSLCIRDCTAVDWTLQVQNPYPEGQHQVYNNLKNVYLKQNNQTYGSGTSCGEGWIQATFPETVYVQSVLVGPLQAWGPPHLQRAKLQVKTSTGDWDTVCKTLTGQVQTIDVQRVGKEWRLYGDYIATSMFIFQS